MTPTEAITAISHAIASGNLNDAERVLEEYACRFGDWLKDNNYTKSDKGWYQYYTKNEVLPNGVMLSMPVYSFKTLPEVYKAFTNQSKQSTP